MSTFSQKFQTFDDAQREGTLEMLATSSVLGWQGISVNYFKAYPSLPKERALIGDSFVLHTKGSANHLRRRWNGRWDSGYSTPHTLCDARKNADRIRSLGTWGQTHLRRFR